MSTSRSVICIRPADLSGRVPFGVSDSAISLVRDCVWVLFGGLVGMDVTYEPAVSLTHTRWP
ncbi:unnamed protein product [Acidithrix sp. C25]|nr:unnamed protein product [Acidithrix sp. C25]